MATFRGKINIFLEPADADGAVCDYLLLDFRDISAFEKTCRVAVAVVVAVVFFFAVAGVFFVVVVVAVVCRLKSGGSSRPIIIQACFGGPLCVPVETSSTCILKTRASKKNGIPPRA